MCKTNDIIIEKIINDEMTNDKIINDEIMNFVITNDKIIVDFKVIKINNHELMNVITSNLFFLFELNIMINNTSRFRFYVSRDHNYENET